MAYIYVKSKKSAKTHAIAVEDKHIYQKSWSLATADAPMYLNKENTTAPTIDNTRGLTVSFDNIVPLFNSNSIMFNRGTGSDNFIGDKVYIKSINLTIDCYLDGANMIASFTHGQAIDIKMNFRLMAVQFPDANFAVSGSSDIQDTVSNWFRTNYIYYRLVNTGGGKQTPFQSNWMNKMRESTAYTGKFKILYDKKFTMGKDCTSHQFELSLPIAGNLTFNSSNIPTNDLLKDIAVFIITPSNNYLDVDCITSDQLTRLSGDKIVAGYANCNTKIKYYDV